MYFRSRAPLRLGLAGGGTDVSPYSDEFGGYVLNTTINLYSYCTISSNDNNEILLSAPDRKETYSQPASAALELTGNLLLHKAIYNRIVRDFNQGRALPCTIVTYSDAPAGSGLGTSSTMAVAIIAAFAEWLKLPLGEYEIAHLAFEIERIELAMAGGKQDQYAAAFGGFNFMEFHANDRVIVNPLRIRPSVQNELQASLLLYYTGVSRDSAKIISEQINNVSSNNTRSIDAMHAVKADAVEMKELLLKGDILGLSKTLGRSWETKKKMASVITNSSIDAIFDAVLGAGAYSGKVSGAGGGGYVMFMIDPTKREHIITTLQQFSGKVQPCHFTNEGVQTWTAR